MFLIGPQAQQFAQKSKNLPLQAL